MLRRYAPLRRAGLKPRKSRLQDPVYLRWIRSQPCIIGTRECRGHIDPHHVGHYGRGRDNDRNAVPLCRRHHDQAHDLRRIEFEARYGVSFQAAISGLNDEYSLVRSTRVA